MATKEVPTKDTYQIFLLEEEVLLLNQRLQLVEHYLNQESMLRETLTSIISEISGSTTTEEKPESTTNRKNSN